MNKLKWNYQIVIKNNKNKNIHLNNIPIINVKAGLMIPNIKDRVYIWNLMKKIYMKLNFRILIINQKILKINKQNRNINKCNNKLMVLILNK